jgi:hypothetical protein
MFCDGQTRSMLETDQKFAGIDSNDKAVKKNPDSSATVWFAPKASARLAGACHVDDRNWHCSKHA